MRTNMLFVLLLLVLAGPAKAQVIPPPALPVVPATPVVEKTAEAAAGNKLWLGIATPGWWIAVGVGTAIWYLFFREEDDGEEFPGPQLGGEEPKRIKPARPPGFSHP